MKDHTEQIYGHDPAGRHHPGRSQRFLPWGREKSMVTEVRTTFIAGRPHAIRDDEHKEEPAQIGGI